MASRVESAGKALGIPIVMSPVTRDCLPDDMLVRRLCRSQLPSFDSPVDLFEPLTLPGQPITEEQTRWLHDYETAVDLLEGGDVHEALVRLVDLEQSLETKSRLIDLLLERCQELIVRDVTPEFNEEGFWAEACFDIARL